MYASKETNQDWFKRITHNLKKNPLVYHFLLQHPNDVINQRLNETGLKSFLMDSHYFKWQYIHQMMKSAGYWVGGNSHMI